MSQACLTFWIQNQGLWGLGIQSSHGWHHEKPMFQNLRFTKEQWITTAWRHQSKKTLLAFSSIQVGMTSPYEKVSIE
jgi:hypothetical protein